MGLIKETMQRNNNIPIKSKKLIKSIGTKHYMQNNIISVFNDSS